MRSVQLIERSPRFSALSPETRLLHEDWHNSTKTSAEAIAAPGTFLKRICAIRDALEEENSELLIDEIISLYNTDKDAVTWIDWDGTYNRILYSDRLQGLKVSATHWLMGQPSVAKHFPIVHFAEGDGAFESSLRTSISNLEEKSLDRLAHELLKSTGHTRELLVTAILSPDTAGMLSIILQHDPHWAKKLGQAKAIKFDVRASALRSDIASVFAKHGLLDRDQEQAIVDEERSRLRVAYLQGRQLEGLVYVNWPHLGNQLDNEFSGQFSLVKRMLLQPNLDDPKTYFDEVVISLSERIAAYILIEGPDNLKTTVSDNLRHGQLPNRFLVAFDRAISFATNALVDPNTLIRELLLTQPASSHWLTSLRTDLISTIKDFNINSLTVWEPNDLKNKVTLAVRDVVKTILGNSNLPQQNELDERPQLSSCLHQLQTILDEFFFAARAELSQRLADYRTKLGNASTTLDATDFAFSDSRKRRFDKHRFFISLREQLDEAEQEALPWIALVKAREQPEAFYLNDVVQLCLVNHRSFGSRQLHVDVAVSERRAKHGIVTLQPEPLLHGRYFVFCETLTRNLLENAFKHSGLGLQCRPKIELILDASRLTFTCRNTVSAARYRYLQAHLPSLQDRATKGNLSAAGEDSGSGLQKARWSFWRFLDVIPTVRLRLIQSPISIEIAIEAKHNHGNIIAQESFDH
jgi:hypothetical protein